jgi:hypothetical protein
MDKAGTEVGLRPRKQHTPILTKPARRRHSPDHVDGKPRQLDLGGFNLNWTRTVTALNIVETSVPTGSFIR